MNKIITLGDIFRNLETEEKAFKFLGYIKDMQKEIARLNNIIEQTQKILYIKLINENKEKIYIQEVIDIIENLKGSDKE